MHRKSVRDDMKQITIRNLDPEVLEKIRALAKQEQISMNKLLAKLLRQALQLDKQKNIPGQNRHHDLDDLCGVWSDEEAEQFDKALSQQRQIDAELWS